MEKLDFETHTFPQPLGHFEVNNCKFNIKYVPPGLLFNWKNLTSVSLRVSVRKCMIHCHEVLIGHHYANIPICCIPPVSPFYIVEKVK